MYKNYIPKWVCVDQQNLGFKHSECILYKLGKSLMLMLTVKALVALHGCRFELHVKPKEGFSSEMLRSSWVLDNQCREHWSWFWGIKWNFFWKHLVVLFPLMWHVSINLQSWQGALSTCTPACRYTDDLHEDDPLNESQRGFFSGSPPPEALHLTWGQHLRWTDPCCFSSALLSGSG